MSYKKGSFKHTVKSKKSISITLKRKIKNQEFDTSHLFKKGHVPHNVGIPFSEEIKKKISLKTRVGMQVPEVKIKVINSNRRIIPERIEKYKKWRRTQISPTKNSSIELKLQNYLKLLHVEFITHYYISEITHSYQCDIFIPSKKLIIEADGCYWHGCEVCNKSLNKNQQEIIERDKLRTKELAEKGYRVIRLWEHEINDISVEKLQRKVKWNS